MELNLIDTISRLVSTPSVNPMGKLASGPKFLEGKLTDLLQTFFDQMGLRHQRQSVLPGRENIIARLDGEVLPEDGGRVILFDAHQDTVRVEGMAIEPWEPRISDGRIYGRGTCDTKGSMAAMLVAVARLAQERPAGMPTVMIACPVDEEHGFTGIRRLGELFGEIGSPKATPTPKALGGRDAIFPRRPDVAIVGEPTELQIVVAHKGAVRWHCHTTGRAAHSSTPQLGQNAIYRMAQVLPLFERYQAEGTDSVAAHPLCGSATLNVGLIHGGMSVNTVPDRCSVAIDRRVLPGEDPAGARQHVIDYIAEHSSFDFPVEHAVPDVVLLPLCDDDNGPLADEFLHAAGPIVGQCEKIGAFYGTHAAEYAAWGIPSIVFGPGSAAQAHTVDEWLAIEQLEKAAEVYYRFALC